MPERAKRFGRELLRSLVQHRVKDLAAQLGFWALLALFPFCIFVLTMIGFIPLHGLDQQLLELIRAAMPDQAAHTFERTLNEVVGRQRGLLLFASLVGAVWSASAGMGSTASAFNQAWHVEETRVWWKLRARTLVLTGALAAGIVVAILGLAIGPNLLHTIGDWFGEARSLARVWGWVRWPLVVFDLLLVLGCLYHFLPNVKQPFRLFTPGALVAVVLWIAASSAFNAYVSHFHAYARSYGTLGTAVILIVWLYLSSLMVLVGCEINACLQRVEEAVAAEVKEVGVRVAG